MNRIWKFFQYGYLIIAIICLVEGLLRWSTDRNRAYLFLGFAVFIVVIFLFKRHFRKKVEKRNNQNL
jgi:membrane protein implicated in regulation of membrane protease activity